MIPYSELLAESATCKIGIFVYTLKGLNNYYCSPNKIYVYAQLGIPMIVSPQPFLTHIVSKYHIGEVLDSGISLENLAELVLKIINNFDSYKQGMKDFLTDYSHENEMAKLKNSILNLLKS